MSAEKTLDIIDLFNFQHRELSVQQISMMLNQPQSSVYRHLKILKEKGYIIETSKGFYKLGYKFLELAKIVKNDISLASIAFPFMTALSSEIEETVILTIVTGLHTVCLEVVTPNQPIKVSSVQGKILPLHAGASSRVFLPYMEKSVIDELAKKNMLTKYTDQTITDVEALYKLSEEIKIKGYAVSDSEVDEGVYAYGVVIKDMDDRLVAALSIAGPRDRMLKKSEKELVEKLMKARNEVEKFL